MRLQSDSAALEQHQNWDLSLLGHSMQPLFSQARYIMVILMPRSRNSYRSSSVRFILFVFTMSDRQQQDSFQGAYPGWHIIFNMAMLRLISFNMDYYWACTTRTESVNLVCLFALNVRLRDSRQARVVTTNDSQQRKNDNRCRILPIPIHSPTTLPTCYTPRCISVGLSLRSMTSCGR